MTSIIITTIVSIIILAVLLFVGFGSSIRKKITNATGTISKRKWRPDPASSGSMAGIVMALFLLVGFLIYYLDQSPGKKIFYSFIKNRFLWIYPVILFLFYILFRMGTEKPVKLFKGIIITITFLFLPLIGFTTARAVNPNFLKITDNKKGNSNTPISQIPPAVIWQDILTVSGDWADIPPIPQNGYNYIFELPSPTTRIEWRYKHYDNSIQELNNLNGQAEMEIVKCSWHNRIPAQIRHVAGTPIQILTTVTGG